MKGKEKKPTHISTTIKAARRGRKYKEQTARCKKNKNKTLFLTELSGKHADSRNVQKPDTSIFILWRRRRQIALLSSYTVHTVHTAHNKIAFTP